MWWKIELNRAARVALNFAILSGGEFIGKLFGFLAFALLARVLGAAEYGHLEFALAIIFFFTLGVDAGLSTFGAREIAKETRATPRLITHIIATRAALALVAFALLALVVAALDKPAALKSLLLLYGLTLFLLPGLLGWVFQGRDLMHYVALASMLRWCIFAAGVWLYVHGPEEVWRVAVVEGFAIFCVVIFYLYGVRRNFGAIRPQIDWRYALSILRQAIPIGASDLVWAVKVYGATVLLGLLVAGAQVGWFAAAQRIVVSLHTFVWLYFFNLLPSLARSAQAPREFLHRLMRTSIQLTAWGSVFIAMVGAAFAEPIITLVYGAQYVPAARTFAILLWLIPLTLLSGHYRFALIAYDHQQLEFLAGAGGAVVNVLLNVLLIFQFGGLGAAWALVLSEVVIGVLAYYFMRRAVEHIPLLPHLARPILAGAVVGGALFALAPLNLWLAATFAASVYLVLLLLIQPQLLADVRALFGQKS